jgi:formate hydrogenlyase subunit 6/NADH:ubiquinone oxidoreductase subunit I
MEWNDIENDFVKERLRKGRPVTIRAIRPDDRRMEVENDIEKCIFCLLCEKNRPTDAIVVSKERKEWQIDRLKCCTHRRCVEVSPKKCLLMHNVFFPSVTARPAGEAAGTSPTGPFGESSATLSTIEKEKEEQG